MSQGHTVSLCQAKQSWSQHSLRWSYTHLYQNPLKGILFINKVPKFCPRFHESDSPQSGNWDQPFSTSSPGDHLYTKSYTLSWEIALKGIAPGTCIQLAVYKSVVHIPGYTIESLVGGLKPQPWLHIISRLSYLASGDI